MVKIIEPCLCGDPACPRCFPVSYADEARIEWIANYFQGKACISCECHIVEEGLCAVVEDEAELDDCPALSAQEAKDSDDYEAERHEARQRARRGER